MPATVRRPGIVSVMFSLDEPKLWLISNKPSGDLTSICGSIVGYTRLKYVLSFARFVSVHFDVTSMYRFGLIVMSSL